MCTKIIFCKNINSSCAAINTLPQLSSRPFGNTSSSKRGTSFARLRAEWLRSRERGYIAGENEILRFVRNDGDNVGRIYQSDTMNLSSSLNGEVRRGTIYNTPTLAAQGLPLQAGAENLSSSVNAKGGKSLA